MRSKPLLPWIKSNVTIAARAVAAKDAGTRSRPRKEGGAARIASFASRSSRSSITPPMASLPAVSLTAGSIAVATTDAVSPASFSIWWAIVVASVQAAPIAHRAANAAVTTPIIHPIHLKPPENIHMRSNTAVSTITAAKAAKAASHARRRRMPRWRTNA